MASLGTSPKKPKSVTYVSGIMCYPSIGMGLVPPEEPIGLVSQYPNDPVSFLKRRKRAEKQRKVGPLNLDGQVDKTFI